MVEWWGDMRYISAWCSAAQCGAVQGGALWDGVVVGAAVRRSIHHLFRLHLLRGSDQVRRARIDARVVAAVIVIVEQILVRGPSAATLNHAK